MTRSNSDQRLFSIIHRIERVNEEIKGLQSDRKDIFAEAKGAGYDLPALRAIIRERAEDQAKREEREAIKQAYLAALGGLADSPLGAAAMGKI